MGHTFPFSAIVGQDEMKLAILISAIDPSLGGVLAQGPASLLALRALEGLGFLLACLPAPSLIRRLVAPQRLSLHLGLWGTYMPTGTALALLLAPPVLGWIATQSSVMVARRPVTVRAMRSASGSEGSYLSVSTALIVCRDTPSRRASSPWLQPCASR